VPEKAPQTEDTFKGVPM